MLPLALLFAIGGCNICGGEKVSVYLFDLKLEGAEPAELTGTQPFEAVDESYKQGGARG